MSKRVSLKSKLISWFATADPAEVEDIIGTGREILRLRTKSQAPEKRKYTRKPKPLVTMKDVRETEL